MKKGKIVRVAGPVVVAEIEARMYDIVHVGAERLIGEVIQINGAQCTVQVYEDTSGLRPNDPVANTGEPLMVELGPGLLSSIYDGIQRPLKALQDQMGDFIKRGATVPALDKEKKWVFKPLVKKGASVKPGDIIGEVQETQMLAHRIMVPLGYEGKVSEIKSGSFKVEDIVCTLDSGKKIALMHKWPVRISRPYAKKLAPNIPLVTGQRIFDALFPIAKGGVAVIPGPFGSGKCITGETPILVNSTVVPIESVFSQNKALNASAIEENEHETIVELQKPLSVRTFDGKKLVEGVATHVYKGKTSQLVRIRTRSGRTVTITPVHKLFKLTESLDIVETQAAKLTPGDYILSPRKLDADEHYSKLVPSPNWRAADRGICAKIKNAVESYAGKHGVTKKYVASLLNVEYKSLLNYCQTNNPPLSFIEKLNELCGNKITVTKFKSERQSHPITLPQVFNEDFSEFLGYVMSDGMIKGSKTIHFFNEDLAVRDRFSYLVEKLFGLVSKEYYAHTVWARSVNSQPIVQFLVGLGFPLKKKSRNIVLPQALLSSPESVVRSFLKAYIICDGHVGKKDLEITTASKAMRGGLCYTLSRLGVLYRAADRIINGRTYYRIFVSPREAIKIDSYYSKKFYFNSSDIVPMTSALFRKILGDTKPYTLEHEGIPTASYYKDMNQTAGTFQRIIQKIDADEKFAQLSQALGHVFCDEVKEVEVIDKTADVYDLTVADTHNFVGGEIPMILHNTVTQQALAKWSDADIIVYIGCGERGNEMTEVLVEFPKLIDNKTNTPLLDRTILIANTSNMPVAAREASVYTGITLAEYYRDMGYNVALMADSTSRWAEAMREISSRLEELPGEEGYPAYLSARLSEFYERAGRVTTQNGAEGSVSVIGAVSPPGGDFSEPVTQGTLRVTKTFWALDAKLAQRRHFPAINWLDSYSLYLDTLSPWFAERVAADWREIVDRVMGILQEEEKLLEIVQLVGSDALPEKEQITLQVARLIREFFLQQNSFHPVDTYSELKKTYAMMKACLSFADMSQATLARGVRAAKIVSVKSRDKLGDVKFEKNYEKNLNETLKAAESEFAKLE